MPGGPASAGPQCEPEADRQPAAGRYDLMLWMRDLRRARRTYPSDQSRGAGAATPVGRNANVEGSRGCRRARRAGRWSERVGTGGARRMLAAALEAKVEACIAGHAGSRERPAGGSWCATGTPGRGRSQGSRRNRRRRGPRTTPRHCWRSTTSPPSTGCTPRRPTRSSPASPPSTFAPGSTKGPGSRPPD
jgi:hypothetical protein